MNRTGCSSRALGSSPPSDVDGARDRAPRGADVSPSLLAARLTRSKTRQCATARAAALAGLVILGAGGAFAQTAPAPSDADLSTAADLLFKRMLVKPNDLDAAFQYAEIETKLGDYEAAIGALERMLFYNPNLPRVKLELGALYFRLRSYEMARSYFNAAIASADTPQDVREEVATFIAAIDRAVAENQFAMFAQIGLRSQSNANAGPNSPIVQALGQNATLSSQFQRTPDWNAFALTTVLHFYDFGDQRGDGWESDLTAYDARQFKVARVNLALIEASTGPRLGLGDSGVSIHPYVLGNAVTLGDAVYLGTVGGGASLRLQLPAAIEIDPGAEYRDRRFANSGDYPTSTLQNGNQWIGYALGSGPLPMIAGLSWQARFAYTHDIAVDYTPYSYNDVSADLSLPYAFAPPAFAHSGANWTFAPFLGYSHTLYGAPDPIVNPVVTRLDQQWRVGATLDMIFYKNIGFAVQAEYLQTQSTVPNYSTRDFMVSGGPTVRF